MPHDHLLVDHQSNGVCLLTLNQPNKLNALSGGMTAALRDTLAELANDRSVGCVVVTGAGRGFCAGGDVTTMNQRYSAAADDLQNAAADDLQNAAADDLQENDGAPASELDGLEDRMRGLYRTHQEVVLPFYRLPIPTIAVVNGPAAGAGFSLAAGADMRIASDQAMFTTAFARIGRSGDYGGTFLIRQLVGPARARELYFTSARVNAQQALDWGIVNHVFPHDSHFEQAMAMAATIAAGPRRAYARMKQVFEAADAADFDEVLRREATNMTVSGFSPEGREFLDKFLARKK